jgi:hypothetical protein
MDIRPSFSASKIGAISGSSRSWDHLSFDELNEYQQNQTRSLDTQRVLDRIQQT